MERAEYCVRSLLVYVHCLEDVRIRSFDDIPGCKDYLGSDESWD